MCRYIREVSVCQVKPSNCFRRLEKLVLPSIFGHRSFIIHDVKLAELSNNSFEWKNVTFLGEGSKHTLTPPTYFITPMIHTPSPNIRTTNWQVTNADSILKQGVAPQISAKAPPSIARDPNTAFFPFLQYPSTILRTAYKNSFTPNQWYQWKAKTLKVCLVLVWRVGDQTLFGRYIPLKDADKWSRDHHENWKFA